MLRIATALSLLMVAQARAGTTCPTEGGDRIVLAAVDPRLELRLGDGRRLRLVGLDPAVQTPGDPDLAETSREALAQTIAGRPLTARVLSGQPDRWGRLPAMAFVAGEQTPGGLAALAVAAGLGRYLAEPAAHTCREELLAAEDKARSATLGLWHDPYYGILAVDDRAAFAERSATTIVAEGRLWRVDAGPFRTKLLFAAPGEDKRGLLVAVVLPKVVKRFGEQGVHFEALVGRTFRLRGLLDLRFGPQVEIAGPDSLDVRPEAPSASAAASGSSSGSP